MNNLLNRKYIKQYQRYIIVLIVYEIDADINSND